jgi:DNA-binding HxlR family transcriptional regulator
MNETKLQEKINHPETTPAECKGMMKPIRDSLDVLNGKWKLPILVALLHGDKRFKQISKEISGITDKMLSKELKDLEMNQLISRTVHNAYPPVVEYSITEHGLSLQNVLLELQKWGSEHRKKIMGK